MWFKPGSREALCSWLRTADRAGLDAYIGCGSFTESGHRTQVNSAGTRAFWLDVDAGPSKPYANYDDAVDAIDAFVERVGLPTPSIVYTGNGVHAWWLLSEHCAAAEWVPAGRRLKELCREHGLNADPDRTADIASILRVPETHNYKDPLNPKLVECYDLEPAVDTKIFLQIIMGRAAPGAAAKAAFSGLNIGAKIANIYDTERRSYAANVADHCQQIGAIRDTQGNVSEPLWYASLGVISKCVDGPTLAHAWSSGHPGYDFAATAQKYSQAETASGPTTCGRFRDINPSGCAGCPHLITSPIQLGYAGIIEPVKVEVAPEEKPWLPEPFKWGPNMQLLFRCKDEDGEWKDQIISQFPIYLSAVRRGEKSPVTMYEFRKKEPHRDWHTFEVPAAEMYKTTWPSFMAQHGCNIRTDGRKAFVWLMEGLVEKIKNSADEGIQYEQYGWKENMASFLLGTTLFKEDGSQIECPGMLEAGNRAQLLAPAARGSLAGWSATANRLYAPGFESQGFALLMPFAAPLMKFITCGQEGGSIFSMSCGGGKGKSTVIAAIASVYGKLEALQIKNSDTVVAKERIQVAAANLPVLWDEWLPGSPKLFEDYVRAFTTGKGKSRGTRTGLVTSAPEGWETILIAGSNGSMIENLSGSSSSEPMNNRVFEIDITIPASCTWDYGRGISGEFMDNRGYAGRAFIKYIVRAEVKAWISEALKQAMANFGTVLNAETTDRYTVRVLACAGVAAKLLNKLGILTFDETKLMAWAMQKAIEATATRREFSQDALTVLMRFLREHSDNCLFTGGPFIRTKPPIIFREPRREINMRLEDSTNRLYVSSDALRRWCQLNNCPYTPIIKDLEEQQIVLNRGRMTQLSAGSSIPPVRCLCWEIDLTHPKVDFARMELKVVQGPIQLVK